MDGKIRYFRGRFKMKLKTTQEIKGCLKNLAVLREYDYLSLHHAGKRSNKNG